MVSTNSGSVAFDPSVMLDGLSLAPVCNGGLALLNESAGLVLDALRAGRGERGAVEALASRYDIEAARAAVDVAATARAFRASGVWPSVKRVSASSTPHLSTVGTEWLLDRTIAPLEEPVRIRIAGPQLARAVAAVLGPESARPQIANPVALIEARRRHGHELWLDGRQTLSGASLMLARSELIRLLLLASGRKRQWLALLHAAAVSDGQAVVLLCGSSGSGKSTLAARLATSGLAFVTDDYAPLEGGSAALWPTPFGLSAKSGSWDVLNPLLPSLAGQETIRTRGRSQRYVEPPRREAGPRPVACIVFPTFQAGEPCRLEPLRPGEALALATHGGGWFESTPKRLAELASWFRRTPAYSLSYGDGEVAAATVRDLLARHASAATGGT